MRSRRLLYLLLAVYFVFLGGSAYYSLIFPVRVLHHGLVTVLLVVWLVGRLRRGQGLPQTPLNRPLLAAVGVWVLSAAAGLDPRVAFEGLWFPLTHVLFFLFIADLVAHGRQRLVMEITFIIGALVVLISALELASWYFGLGVIPGTDVGWIDVIGQGAWLPLELPRLALAMNVSTLLAGFTAPLVILAAGWALTARREYGAGLWGLAAALAVVLILTLSRGGLISLAGAAGTFAVFRLVQNRRVTRRIPARVVVAGALLAGMVLVLGVVALSAIPARRFGDEGRLDMWQSAVVLTRDHPVIGVGTGQFGRAFREVRDPELAQDKLASAHNLYLNTVAETGLIGAAVGVWLAVAAGRAWLVNWRSASGGRRVRLETTLAALVGLGVHSLVDVFTTTPLLLLIAVLAAYSVMRPREGFEVVPAERRWTALAALVGVLLYGGWFAVLDTAQARYQASLSGGERALEDAQAAAALDPGLGLYSLHLDNLDGTEAAYRRALEREPSWDVGWVTLAALQEASGDLTGAAASLERAVAINARTPARLHRVRLLEAEGDTSADRLISDYLDALEALRLLPVSDYWGQTPLRRRVVERYGQDARFPLDWRYRALLAHHPARAAERVPDVPATAAEWWVVGEAALQHGEAGEALAAFEQAVALSPADGDLYASRARARLASDAALTADALRDLNIAVLLGTRFEYPNAVRVVLASTPEEASRWRISALPPRARLQEFAAVLYGRPAAFDWPAAMRLPGPGRAAMTPWHELALGYLEAGQPDAAANIYRAILDYAPDDVEAREALANLTERLAAVS